MSKYIWNAKDYEQNSQVQQKWAKELITKLNLKGTEDILDLGCGDGKVTAEQIPPEKRDEFIKVLRIYKTTTNRLSW